MDVTQQRVLCFSFIKATFTRYRTNFLPVENLTVHFVRTEPCNIFAPFTWN